MTDLQQLILDMQACQQTEGQSVYDHGIAVRDHTFQLLGFLETGQIKGYWKIPDWLVVYRTQFASALLPRSTIEEYTVYHDCGKPYCKSDGKRKFPNHAEVSYLRWLDVGGKLSTARLMKFDMMVHTMKSADVDTFAALPEAATLLLVGLAEIHANATIFGGMESTSFKIKWRQIDRRGGAICLKLFLPVSQYGT
jgi:hypothetical protein